MDDDRARALRNDSIIAEAERVGLLAGEKTEHISVRTTPALLAEAKRQTGLTSTSAVVQLALISLVGPDPAVKFLLDNFGALGPDHTLDV